MDTVENPLKCISLVWSHLDTMQSRQHGLLDTPRKWILTMRSHVSHLSGCDCNQTHGCNSRLQHQLPCFRVLGDISRQTDSAGTLAGRVLPARHQTVDVLQQLWLTGTWISTQQDVYVRPTTDSFYAASQTLTKKVKVAHTRLPSVGFCSWSRFLAASPQVTQVINPAVGCHYFPPGLQLAPQP